MSRITATQHTIEELYSLKWGKEVKIRDILKELYIIQNMNVREVAKELRVSQGTVSNWLRYSGIPAKTWGIPEELLRQEGSN